MSLIMEQIKPEHPKLFALELGKIAETEFVYTLATANNNVYTLASTNYNHSAPNLVIMYGTIRS